MAYDYSWLTNPVHPFTAGNNANDASMARSAGFSPTQAAADEQAQYQNYMDSIGKIGYDPSKRLQTNVWNNPNISSLENLYGTGILGDQQILKNQQNTNGPQVQGAPEIPTGDARGSSFSDVWNNPIPQIGLAAMSLGSSGLLDGAVAAGDASLAGDAALPSLSGALGSAGNGLGSLFGDATLGTDIGSGLSGIKSAIGSGLSNFADNSGLSQLWGGTAGQTSDLSALGNAVDTAAPNLDATAGATNPVDSAPGGASSSVAAGANAPGSAGVGGGTLQGFSSNPGESSAIGSAQGGGFNYDLNGNAATPSELGASAGIGGTQPAPSAFNYDVAGNAAGASSYSPTQQFLNAATSNAATSGGKAMGLSSLFSGAPGSVANGLLKGGLSYLTNNNNSSGLNAITNASNQAQQNFQPYMAAGTQAENTLSNLYGNNGAGAQTTAMNNFQNTPGYQFQMQQGLNAMNANNAAMGQTLSGNAQQGINNYAQGVASQGYNNYVNQLQNLASGGMSAAGGASTAGLTGAGAKAQIGQNNANNQNTSIGSGLAGLFPGANSVDLSKLIPGMTSASNGILSMFG